MAVSFVPDACSALAIQACIAAKECLLGPSTEDSPIALEATIEGLDGVNVELRDTLDTQATCLGDALTEAVVAAGAIPPSIPPPPPLPDLSSCKAALQPLKAAAEDPLAFLLGVIEIEFERHPSVRKCSFCRRALASPRPTGD